MDARRGAVVVAAAAAGALWLLRRRRRRRRALLLPQGFAANRRFALAAGRGEVAVSDDGVAVVDPSGGGEYTPFSDVTYIECRAGAAAATVRTAPGGCPDVALRFADADTAAAFLAAAREALYPAAPVTIHVLLNPFAGTGDGRRVWRQRVAPILDASPHTVALHVTERRGHAEEIAAALTLAPGDIVAVVSGDGLIHEAVNGLMRRGDGVAARVCIAHIPAGSGNGLAYSLGIGGCVERAAAAAVRGRSAPLDLFELRGRGGEAPPRHGFLTVTYAMVADVDIGSEWMRCLGDLRFTLYAVWLLLRRPRYPMRVRWQAAGGGEGGEHTAELSYFLLTNVSHLGRESCLAPGLSPGSGHMQLQLLPAAASFRQLLKVFLTMDDGGHLAEPTPVIARDVVALDAEPDPARRLVVDGELVATEPFRVRVLPGAARVIVPAGAGR